MVPNDKCLFIICQYSSSKAFRNITRRIFLIKFKNSIWCHCIVGKNVEIFQWERKSLDFYIYCIFPMVSLRSIFVTTHRGNWSLITLRHFGDIIEDIWQYWCSLAISAISQKIFDLFFLTVRKISLRSFPQFMTVTRTLFLCIISKVEKLATA